LIWAAAPDVPAESPPPQADTAATATIINPLHTRLVNEVMKATVSRMSFAMISRV
jgi:hypothetical protein